MLQRYRNKRFKPRVLALIAKVNEILEEYDGRALTARQVYYRLVAADIIPNTPTSYKNFTGTLADARYAGLVDWDLIEDRGRVAKAVQEYDSILDVVEAAKDSFCLRRWEGQENYVEVWVEKQALEGQLIPIISNWHVTLMVNKGYSSASAMRESAMRIMRRCGQEPQEEPECAGCGSIEGADARGNCRDCYVKFEPKAVASEGDRRPIILYLGDFDPSGEDMVRDIRDRLSEFGVQDLEVVKVGLTMPQIKQLKPPPNPAKLSDSRAKDFIKKWGRHSWELDAIPPKMLDRLVSDAIEERCDVDQMNEVKAREAEQREHLDKAVEVVKDPDNKVVIDVTEYDVIGRRFDALGQQIKKPRADVCNSTADCGHELVVKLKKKPSKGKKK